MNAEHSTAAAMDRPAASRNDLLDALGRANFAPEGRPFVSAGLASVDAAGASDGTAESRSVWLDVLSRLRVRWWR